MCDNILIPLGGKKTDSCIPETPRPVSRVGSCPRGSLDLVSKVDSPQIKLPVMPPSPSPLTSHTVLGKSSLPKLPNNVLKSEKVVALPPISSSLSNNVLPPLPSVSSTPVEEVELKLMETSSTRPKVEAVFNAEEEMVGSSEVSTLSTQSTKLVDDTSTAEFQTYGGVVQDKDVEQALVDSGFIPTEKILTQDREGRINCHFIKTRDKLGHSSFVEVDTDYTNGMGFVKVSPNEEVMTVSSEASVIPYSMKIGTFEANNDLYGVGFVCDNGVCMMQRKDPSLKPTETVFSYSTGGENRSGIMQDHPVPYPIVKMTDILANPREVQNSIVNSHTRMRSVAFNQCQKEVENLKKKVGELNREICEFEKNSNEVSNVLACNINELLKYHKGYENMGELCQKDRNKMKMIQFNLQKRHDLLNDHISLCKSVKERSNKISAITEELEGINTYMVELFENLNTIFYE